MNNNVGLLFSAAFLLAANASFAQTDSLVLSSGTTASNGTVSLNLNLASATSHEVALQWTLAYPPNSVISISATAGTAAIAANKTLNCFAGSGTYTCLIYGMNTTIIGNGTVAFVDLTMAAGTSATSISLNNTVGSSASGSGIVVVPTGGVVTGVGAPVIPSAVTCAPSSLGRGAVSTCIVTLNQAAPAGGSSVTLSSSNAELTVPASVTIAAGSKSANFAATTAPLGTNQSAIVTASLGGTSTTATIRLAPPTDLTLGKAAMQSSTFSGNVGASAAVDGDTDGDYWDGSVSHTDEGTNAWWQVDLGASSTIHTIHIWNRTDCCNSRLSDYWVFVSDTPFNASDTPSTLQNRSGTWGSHQTTLPNPSTVIDTGGVQGRYIRVQLSGTNYLALAEVQAFTEVVPVQTATKSSTYPGNVGASAAVDGNIDGDYRDGSVSHTNDDTNAWWQVDLGASSMINMITVWNRTDCCSGRLSDYWVFISDTPFNASDTPSALQNRPGTWGSHQTTQPNPSAVIDTGGVQGRYIRVQLSGTNYLALAEVQVR